MAIWEILLAAGLPSAMIGLCAALLQRKLVKGQERDEERDRLRQQSEMIMLNSINAAIALGEAAATAMKNGHANGETAAALEYARKVKHEQKEFFTRQGVEHLYGGVKWKKPI